MLAPSSIVRRLPREKWERSDPDVLAALGEKIATLSAQLNADSYRLLALIAEFDRLEGWKREGFASCAGWLAYRTQLDKMTAREKVRIAKALTTLPKTSEAMARGELSFSQVRAITRAADAECEEELLEHARTMSAAKLEKLARSWKKLGREEEADLEARVHDSRTLSIFPNDEGAYLIRGCLEPQFATLLMRAVEAASDALYRGSVPETTPQQRRADALILIVERALEAGFSGNAETEGRRDVEARRDFEAQRDLEGQRLEENSRGGRGSDVAPGEDEGVSAETAIRGTASESPSPPLAVRLPQSERYTVIVHVDADGLRAVGEPGSAHLEDGTRVSAETARRISCDASVVRVGQSPDGRWREVEGKRRTVPPRLRRALEIRDGGCRFPGCGSRFTQAHHIHHWADGGATRLSNLVSLCAQHHRLLHEGGFRLETDPRRPEHPIFFSPRGTRIPEVPPKMTLDAVLLGRSGRRTVPRWEDDVPLAFYLRALEALN